VLRSLQIRNFKSFAGTTLDFAPLTLILGANGAGKSNVFDALRFLRYVGEGMSVRDAIEGYASAEPGQLRVSGVRGGGREVARLGSDDTVFSLEVEARADSDTLRYLIDIDVPRHRVVRERLWSRQHQREYVFDTHPDVEPPAQPEDSPILMARYYRKSAGRRPQTEFDASRPILAQFTGRKANSIENEEPAERMRQELRAITPLELRPEALRQYSPGGTNGLGEHGENFASMVAALLDKVPADEDAGRRVDAIEAWLNELTPNSVGSLAVERAPTGEVIFAATEAGREQPLTARSLSDGTVRFAALAYVLLGESRRRTLLIEEIENGIHPARADLLVRMLESTAAKDPATQALCTTHSPALLAAASKQTAMDALVIGWNAEQDCSTVAKVRDLPDLQAVLDQSDLGELQSDGWLQFAAS
jgi:hypothetical protein